MRHLEIQYASVPLGHVTTMHVLLPEYGEGKAPWRVLYLLHGLSDDSTMWLRRSNIELYAAGRNLVVVMPDGGRGFYTDAKQGDAYWTAIAEEVPAQIEQMFPVSRRREDRFVAGLSMGGYGALKMALRLPEKFAAAYAMSSVADQEVWRTKHRPGPMMDAIWGTGKLEEEDNLFTLAERTAKHPNPPRIRMVCGNEDFMHEDNLRLRDHFRKVGYPGYSYGEADGGHEWRLWDHWMKTEGLDFLLNG